MVWQGHHRDEAAKLMGIKPKSLLPAGNVRERRMSPDALLFRNRSRGAYREDTLSDDFGDVREIAFPGDKRRLMDMRRSGTIEAVAGEAEPMTIAARMANS